jgi:hypothetical protein
LIRLLLLTLLLLTLLMQPGCTYSTHPIFSEQDNVFDEALVGTWKAEGPMSEVGIFEVSRCETERNSYQVVLRNQADVKQGTFQLYLSHIGQRKFLTAKFERPSTEEKNTDLSTATTWYLTYVIDQWEGGQINARLLRGDWLAGQVKGNPGIVKHEWIVRQGDSKKQDLLLTAATPELRDFILSHVDNKEAWLPGAFRKIR